MNARSLSRTEVIARWKADLSAGMVVFFIALPLNLGIALASGAPLTSGILSGVIGGLVVSLISGSALSVSGPAAGLTLIVLSAIQQLPTFEVFLCAVALAGLMQIVLGAVRAGVVALYFPMAVIKGMLAAIGLVIILKQIPHMLGLNADAFGPIQFSTSDGHNIFSEIYYALLEARLGSLSVGLLSLALLVAWGRPAIQARVPLLKVVPGPLVVVLLGITATLVFEGLSPDWHITAAQRVNLPLKASPLGWASELRFADWTGINNPDVWRIALTLAIIASVESLLSVEAIDQLDPLHRQSPKNRELIAQGAGNLFAGLLGAIPISAVIVRSSVNLTAGAKSRWSGFTHGLLLLLATVFVARWLNMIPLAVLAAILILTGYRLTRPRLYRQFLGRSSNQFFPFIITVLAILFTDLLIGIGIGMVFSVFFILNANYKLPLQKKLSEEEDGRKRIEIKLTEVMSFLNKASLSKALDEMPAGSHVILDARGVIYFDDDVLGVIKKFRRTARQRGIQFELINH